MASNKSGMSGASNGSGGSLASTLLAVLAGGIAGGALLLAGSKALGDKLTDMQVEEYEKIERMREEARKFANRIASIEDGSIFEDEDFDDDFDDFDDFDDDDFID